MGSQIYYHFLSSKNAFDDLINKRIRVSTLDSLNDPFELLPYLRYEYETRKNYHKIRKAISKKWGLLCFSETWREPLLWSHYANNHTGIALGFEISRYGIVKVQYRKDPLRIQIELTDNQEENEGLFLNLAKIKYINWKYEQEHRLVVKLKDCMFSNNCYYLPIGNNLKLKEIRLGAKYNYSENPKVIKNLALGFGAEIIPSRLQWQGYNINRDGGQRAVRFNVYK